MGTATIAKVWLYRNTYTSTRRTWFEAECDALPVRTNVAELDGENVVFTGEDEASVIAQIKQALQSRGIHGVMRVQN